MSWSSKGVSEGCGRGLGISSQVVFDEWCFYRLKVLRVGIAKYCFLFEKWNSGCVGKARMFRRQKGGMVVWKVEGDVVLGLSSGYWQLLVNWLAVTLTLSVVARTVGTVGASGARSIFKVAYCQQSYRRVCLLEIPYFVWKERCDHAREFVMCIIQLLPMHMCRSIAVDGIGNNSIQDPTG